MARLGLERHSRSDRGSWPFIVGAIIVVPLGLLAVLAFIILGGRAWTGTFGPTGTNNLPARVPPDAAMYGVYRLAGSNRRYLTDGGQSSFRLGPEHRVELDRVPSVDSDGNLLCASSGSGTWQAYQWGQSDITLAVTVDAIKPGTANVPLCAKGKGFSFFILGHTAPYRLWENIGDPDGGDGLDYERQ